MKYRDAGVDLSRSDEFIKKIHSLAIPTMADQTLAQVGGFAGCFELPEGYSKPVLVSSTDGVGTKLLLALDDEERLSRIGYDLVAMVVNDIICCGAKPLFFLDYYATGQIDLKMGTAVVTGIADACFECGISLIGGETAELPGLYSTSRKEFDLAGFGVGIVDKEDIIDGQKNIHEGDIIIGIESSGPHSNGYSLIRKIMAECSPYPEPEMVDQIMAPTHLYPSIFEQFRLMNITPKGIANITGGGFYENLPRIVDTAWFQCNIDTSAWPKLDVFDWIQLVGNVPDKEMYSVFNMGIGLVVIVASEDEARALKAIKDCEFKAWSIGEVLARGSQTQPTINLS